MSFSEDLLSEAIDKYTDIERKIQRKNASKAEEIINARTREIINAYNYIISIPREIWNDDSITKGIKKNQQKINYKTYTIERPKTLKH